MLADYGAPDSERFGPRLVNGAPNPPYAIDEA
jgi:hypothetical protein